MARSFTVTDLPHNPYKFVISKSMNYLLAAVWTYIMVNVTLLALDWCRFFEINGVYIHLQAFVCPRLNSCYWMCHCLDYKTLWLIQYLVMLRLISFAIIERQLSGYHIRITNRSKNRTKNQSNAWRQPYLGFLGYIIMFCNRVMCVASMS
jgi:hypothetical protein